ncbi:MAG: LysR family transcriptional regulator, partial [Anaerolineae bacterium]|nr:LysR family transcriptional regulator [Anaerolineae bacterium]
MLNLSEMQVFTVAAETENFSEAARRLRLSQPAVSQQIRSLENYLDVELFLRSGRGVTLTEAGGALLPLARELLDLSRRIEETMRSLEGQVVGHLVIGCTTTAGKYMLPLVAAAFIQHHPNFQVTIEMCSCASIVNPLLAQEVHLGISSTKIVHRDMECQPFFTDHVVLVVPADHPFAHRSSVPPVELLDQPFILREEGSSTCQMVQEGLAG